MAEKVFELPKEIQLLPQEELDKRKRQAARAGKVFLLASAILLTVEAVTALALTQRKSSYRQLVQTSTDLSVALSQLEKKQETEKQFLQLNQNLNLLKLVWQEKADAAALLTLIEKDIPVDVILTSAQLSSYWDLRGQSGAYASVFYFINNLKKEETIESANLSSLSRAEPGQPIEFGIKVELK